MTENELATQKMLTRMAEDIAAIKKTVEDDHKAVFGNGQPGLVERVTRLETKAAMKNILPFALLGALLFLAASCGMFRQPAGTTNNIGYQINNDPSSQPTIQIGSNGAQATGIYGGEISGGETGGSPLIGNNVGTANRAVDADVSAALQKDTRASGQTQARDSSPQTVTQTPTTTETATSEKNVSVPVSVGQKAESAAPAAQ